MKILNHDIDYRWQDGEINRELLEGDIEEIEESIQDGLKEGIIEQFDVEKGHYVQCSWKISLATELSIQ